MFTVKFMQGRFFLVVAETESEALRKVIKENPELANADILDIHATSDIFEI